MKEGIKVTHKYGMRQVKQLPHVIHAMHIQRSTYSRDIESGKLVKIPEHSIRVKYRRGEGKDVEIVEKEFRLKAHPDNMGLGEYRSLVSFLKSETNENKGT